MKKNNYKEVLFSGLLIGIIFDLIQVVLVLFAFAIGYPNTRIFFRDK